MAPIGGSGVNDDVAEDGVAQGTMALSLTQTFSANTNVALTCRRASQEITSGVAAKETRIVVLKVDSLARAAVTN